MSRVGSGPCNRRVRVSPPDSAAIAAAFAELRENLDVSLRFPEPVLADAEQVGPLATTAGRRRDRDPVRHDRPAGVDGPRPGAAPRAARERLPRPVRDRRRRSLRRAGGPMDQEAHDAARRSTHRTRTRGSTRLRSPRARAACFPARHVPRSSGRWRSTRAARAIEVDVRRALVRSREKLDYAGVQRSLDDGTAPSRCSSCARSACSARSARQRRGGIDLPIPEQEVTRGRTATSSRFRAPLPVEGWNAQISLMTGPGGGRADADGASSASSARCRRRAEGRRAAAPHGEGARDRVAAAS